MNSYINTNRVLSFLWISCSVLILQSCNPTSPDIKKENKIQQKVVLIGFSGPLTGNTAHVGVDYQNGIKLAIEDMNKQGIALNGHPLLFRLIPQNDGGDPRMATTAASFLTDKGVTAVIGHVDSGCTIASSSIYNKSNVIQIAPSVSNQKYTQQGFLNTFRMMSPDTVQGKMIAQYISQMVKNPHVSIIDDGSSYGQNLSNHVETSLRAREIKIAGHEYTYRDNVDYAAILTRINKASPNVIFFAGTDAQAAGIASQLHILNPSILFVTGDMACTPRFVLLAGKSADGTYCSRNSLPLDQLPRVIDFRTRYEKKFSVPMQPYALFAYDATKLVGHAIMGAQTLDKVKLADYIHQNKFDGLTGNISFKKNGDPASSGITIFRISAGKFVVEKVYSDSKFSCKIHQDNTAKE